MNKTSIFLCFVLLGGLGCSVVSKPNVYQVTEEGTFLNEVIWDPLFIIDALEVDESVLELFAENVIQGRVKISEDLVTYCLLELKTARLPVEAVMRDPNMNVYFWMAKSWVGVIRRNGNSKFMGDNAHNGVEDFGHVNFGFEASNFSAFRLFGNWWYFDRTL